MKQINNFNKFNKPTTSVNEEGPLMSKARRVVTGQSAGDEIHKLPESQQRRLVELYLEDPKEAARYLRSIIVKEKNSQFGLGLALTIAGAGMIYKAANMEPPKPEELKPEPKPDDIGPEPAPDTSGEDYIVKRGDSWWKIAKEHLPAGSSDKDILAYTKQLAGENGADHLYSGKYGSPGLKPDAWTDLDSGEYVGKGNITDADKLYPGEKIQILPFKGGI